MAFYSVTNDVIGVTPPIRVSLSMSRRVIFSSSTICARARVHSLLLSDLSYSPDLALTLTTGRWEFASKPSE